jgi:hypothetical protein
MKLKTLIISVICLAVLILQITPALAEDDETTTLEILSVTGGFYGATVEVKNAGNVSAEKVYVIISIKGGILNKINVTFNEHRGGCDACGPPIEPGAVITENSMDEGLVVGFGLVDISVKSYAKNAPEVSEEKTGFVIGPFVIVL